MNNNTELNILKPFPLFVFLSFYSPIILASTIVLLSFVLQNFKGIIYLIWLVILTVLRGFVYAMGGNKVNAVENAKDGSICNSIIYTEYNNSTYSAFVFAFTIVYLSYPMFTYGSPNFWLISGLIIYFVTDIVIKSAKFCITNTVDVFMNIFFGCIISALVVTFMYSIGKGEYLFFNEVSSNKDVCYQPSKQTFKCSVYKNGNLISSTNMVQ
jgi:hypothetical protein